jgi:TATA-box binding protein (TBP) (component of TFIID and TFIIIB)
MVGNIKSRNITINLKLKIPILCNTCGEEHINTIDGENKQNSYTCPHCSSTYNPDRVLNHIEDKSEQNGYKTQNHKNRSLTVKIDSYCVMFWGTGVMSLSGSINKQQIEEHVKEYLKDINLEYTICKIETSHLITVYNLEHAVELNELQHKYNPNQDLPNLSLSKEPSKSLRSLVFENDKVRAELYNSGKLVVRNSSKKYSDTIFSQIKNYIRSNYTNLIESPPNIKSKEKMLKFESHNPNELPSDEIRQLKEHANNINI